MASGADEFRAEARSKPGDVAQRKIGGWSFCLSYGAVNPQWAVRALEETGMRIRVEGREEDFTDKVAARLRATTAEELAVAKKELAGEWMLSVKPFPPTRTPTEKDLVFLGRTLVALHVPEGSETETPLAGSGSRCWLWRDA